MEYLTVRGAYGRTYTDPADILADWNADKDFQIVSVGRYMGSYINRPQQTPAITINVRYNNDVDVFPIEYRADYEECPDCKGDFRMVGHTDHYDDEIDMVPGFNRMEE
jgi:hypothetical protein